MGTFHDLETFTTQENNAKFLGVYRYIIELGLIQEPLHSVNHPTRLSVLTTELLKIEKLHDKSAINTHFPILPTRIGSIVLILGSFLVGSIVSPT